MVLHYKRQAIPQLLARQCISEAPARGTTNNLQSSSLQQHRRLGSSQSSPCRDIPDIFDSQSPAKGTKAHKSSLRSMQNYGIWRHGMPKYYELRDFSASVQTKCLHAIRDIRIAWRHFLNSVFEYISGVRGIRKFFSSLQSVGQGLGFSSHSDSGFPLPHNAPERIRQCSSRRM